MNHDTAVLDTAVLDTVVPDSASLDSPVADRAGWAGGDRDMCVDVVEQLLATAWAATSSQSEPDGLRAIAAALIEDGNPIPALSTPQAAHHLLAAALPAAHHAHREALAARQDTEQDWDAFRADVRRRAAHAVQDNRICLDGTNSALRQFAIDELRVEYRVEMHVPVTVYVHAADTDSAYQAAEQEIRDEIQGEGLDFDTDDMTRYYAEATDNALDLDD